MPHTQSGAVQKGGRMKTLKMPYGGGKKAGSSAEARTGTGYMDKPSSKASGPMTPGGSKGKGGY